MFTKLYLVLWKNGVIRKRHWLLTIVEIIIPILLFALVACGRAKLNGLKKINITEPEFYNKETEFDIYNHIPHSSLRIWYAPNTTFYENIITEVKIRFCLPPENVTAFESEEKLKEYYNNFNFDGITLVSILFKGDDPKHLDYDLRIHEKYLTWNTEKLYQSSFITAPTNTEDRGSSKYVYKGFVGFQIALTKAFIETTLNWDIVNASFSVQQFPYPPHVEDSGLSKLFVHFLPLVTFFSFIFLCPAVLKRILEEKESGIRELMKIVGLKSWMLWLGWFIHGLFCNLFGIAVIVILMKTPLFDVEYPPIEFCHWSILSVFLLLYCMTSIVFCFFISAIFTKQAVGMVSGILSWIFSYFIPRKFLNSHENLQWRYKIIMGIFPNMALQFGYNAIQVYETRGIGVQWDNFHKSGGEGENDVTMLHVFVMYLVDMLIYMLLTIYISNVNPGKHGAPKSYLYPIKLLSKLSHIIQRKFTKVIPKFSETTSELDSLRSYVEWPNNGLEHCISFKGVTKKYGDNTIALDELTLDFYKNQITVLMGENGAGKTSTISLLTGMTAVTSGAIKIDGKNIRWDLDEARKRVGFCPQHNLLFPDLTVKEHLKFFGILKGKSWFGAEKEADKKLEKVGLDESKDCLPHQLSGGMKRKLCLAIALVGDSPILVLDEPTSGMDYAARHSMWNFIKDLRKDRTILLTTHFMDEADALADWICMLYRGRLQCYGTPKFLKNKYKAGYRLSLIMNGPISETKISVTDDEVLNDDRVAKPKPKSKPRMITKLEIRMKKLCNGIEMISHNGKKLVYKLPEIDAAQYVGLFDMLEREKTSFFIDKIGLSLTTLDDLFITAKKQADEDTNNDKSFDASSLERCIKDLSANSGKKSSSFLKNFGALIKKRWYFFQRKYYLYLPAILVALAVFVTTFILAQDNTEYIGNGGPEFDLSLSKNYGKSLVYFSGLNSPSNYYKKIVLSQNGDAVAAINVYQSIIDKATENNAFYQKHMLAAAEFGIGDDKYHPDYLSVNCLYSSNPIHSAAISVHLCTNAIVKLYLGDDYSITTRNYPLKTVYTDSIPSRISETQIVILWLILVPIGCLFLMSNFIIFPNFEIPTNFIRIQLMAGISPFIYWLSHIIFDFFIFALKSAIIFGVLIGINMLLYNSFWLDKLWALIIILSIYWIAALPFTYLFSRGKTIAGGFAYLVTVGLLTGILPTLLIYFMEYTETYVKIAEILKYIFMATLPQFGISYNVIRFCRKYAENYNWKNMDPLTKELYCKIEENHPCCCGRDDTVQCFKHKSYFYNEKFELNYDIFAMFGCFLIYFIVLIFLTKLHSSSYFSCFTRKQNGSNSVGNENETAKSKLNDGENECLQPSEVLSVESKDHNKLLVDRVAKKMGKRKVVRGVSLRTKTRQCYALLGTNGAGKTTTLRMIAGELATDEGNIQIRDGTETFDASKNEEYYQNLGFCPQQDVLNFALTGRKLITIMAIMKGYENPTEIAEHLLKIFDLEKCANKPCENFSGGNRRKLNTSLAFIGLPSVILLDEPTNGVDPSSRRKFWDVLAGVKNSDKHNSSIVLCSHSMDECEALSDRIIIMKDGEVVKNDELHVLKSELSAGLTVKFKFYSTADITRIKEEICNKLKKDLREKFFTKCEINLIIRADEIVENILQFSFKITEVCLSILFDVANRIKDNYWNFIEDFVISESSLEDLFLSVAKPLSPPILNC